MAFEYGAVLIGIKCYFSLEPGCPLINVAFNLEEVKENQLITKFTTDKKYDERLTAVKIRAIEGIWIGLK